MRTMTFDATSSPCMIQFMEKRPVKIHIAASPKAAKAFIEVHK